MHLISKRFPLSMAAIMAFGLMLALLSIQPVRAADPVKLSLGPPSQNVSTGSTFQMAINLTTFGQAVDTVSASLTYPSDRLTCQSVTTTSDFTFIPQPDVCSGGTILVQRGRSSNYTANGVIALVTFKALIPGSAPVHLNDSSVALTGGEDVPYTTEDANYLVVSGPKIYAWTYAGQTSSKPLNNILPGQTATFTVSALNSGFYTWTNSGANPVRLGASRPNDRTSPFATPSWLSPARAATLNEASVAPGQTGTFTFSVQTPSQPGNYKEYYNLLAEGITWMNDPGLYFGVTVSPPTYTWSLVGQGAYTDASKATPLNLSQLTPNQTGWLELKVRNTGNMTWTNSGPNPVRIGSSRPLERVSRYATPAWLTPSRPGNLVEASVAPGAVGTFEFPITAPSTTGTYIEYFTPLAEGITWMNDIGLSFYTVVSRTYTWSLVGQGAYTDASKATPLNLSQLTPNQTGWLELKVRNTGNMTWTNSGPNPVRIGSSRPLERVSRYATPAWLTPSRPGNLVEASVAPGAVGTFEFPITAPSTTGTYIEYFTPLAEGITWMNDIGLSFYTVVNPGGGK